VPYRDWTSSRSPRHYVCRVNEVLRMRSKKIDRGLGLGQMMRSRLLPKSMVIAGLLVQQALAAQSCDDALMVINTCIGGDGAFYSVTLVTAILLRSAGLTSKRLIASARASRLVSAVDAYREAQRFYLFGPKKLLLGERHNFR
jgi:hypothetical protein